jgi:hypothetical protein
MKRCLILLLCILPFLSYRPAHAAADTAPILITEVQTGADASSQEFVELHNQQSTPMAVDGWQIQYISASGKTTSTLATLQGSIQPSSDVLLSYNHYLANADLTFTESSGSGVLAASAGHIRLIDNNQILIDCISWGSSASDITGCDSIKTAPINGQSIQRPLVDGTYDRALGVVIASPPNPNGGGIVLTTPPPVDPPGAPNDPPTSYPAIQITELLADPAARQTDAADEFIELYNPTDTAVDLAGYVLQTGLNNTYHYDLPSLTLEPHQYKALYSQVTALSLSNASSKARLLAPDGSIVSDTAVYENTREGEAWALIDGVWQITTQPTPSAANILAQPSGQGSNDTTTSSSTTFEVNCPAGKYRNPATNRCKTIETTGDLQACDAGQVRNPATNRCRSAAAAATGTFTACQAGYERNPDTNRCRKITTTSATITPCKQGYERNPETNRCRKISLAANTHSSSPETATHALSKLTAKIVIGIVVVAIAYAIYEYRQEMQQLFLRLRARFAATKKPH